MQDENSILGSDKILKKVNCEYIIQDHGSCIEYHKEEEKKNNFGDHIM